MVSRDRTDSAHLDEGEFQRFRDVLRDISGIDLGHNKQYLVANRVRRILLANNFNNLTELMRRIDNGRDRQLRQQVVDAMTTNETFWFRDVYPFSYLSKTLLPALHAQKRGAPLRIWSAACSSGQEPYSLSIVVEEYFRTAGRRFPVEIVATDLSSAVLERARLGEYDRLSIGRGLSDERFNKFFHPAGADTWRVADEIRNRVQFRSLNLQDSYFLLGQFDIVLCRNVLIYFSPHLKREILYKINRVIKPRGYLFLGSSESLGDAGDVFEVIHCNPGVVYRAR